ncbi:MAG TPA: hypothetical protein VHS96_11250 [Bacteroidia bacterium]|nr:hypothetical protein [Bacteroidia bacterium]
MMELQSGSGNPSGINEPKPDKGFWRWACLVLGLLFVIAPAMQVYMAVKPTLDMLDFIPLSYYLEEMTPLIVMLNATFVAAICFLVGGILLMIGKRWGYVLTVAASAFALTTVLEAIVAILIVGQQSDSPMIGIALDEIYSMTGIWTIIALLLEMTALILLNFKKARLFLKVRKLEKWMAVAIALLLFLDLNICILTTLEL